MLLPNIRRLSYLYVSGDYEARFEAPLGFVADHVGDHLGRVCGGGGFVAEDELAGAVLAPVFAELLTQVLDISVHHADVDAFFRSIDAERPDAETCEGSHVAGFSALRLDDEDTPPRRRGGLADGIAVLN